MNSWAPVMSGQRRSQRTNHKSDPTIHATQRDLTKTTRHKLRQFTPKNQNIVTPELCGRSHCHLHFSLYESARSVRVPGKRQNRFKLHGRKARVLARVCGHGNLTSIEQRKTMQNVHLRAKHDTGNVPSTTTTKRHVSFDSRAVSAQPYFTLNA